LDWTQADLAKRAGTSAVSVGHYERGNGVSSRLIEKLRHAFEAAGIRFESDWGVSYRKNRRQPKRTP